MSEGNYFTGPVTDTAADSIIRMGCCMYFAKTSMNIMARRAFSIPTSKSILETMSVFKQLVGMIDSSVSRLGAISCTQMMGASDYDKKLLNDFGRPDILVRGIEEFLIKFIVEKIENIEGLDSPPIGIDISSRGTQVELTPDKVRELVENGALSLYSSEAEDAFSDDLVERKDEFFMEVFGVELWDVSQKGEPEFFAKKDSAPPPKGLDEFLKGLGK